MDAMGDCELMANPVEMPPAAIPHCFGKLVAAVEADAALEVQAA